MNKIYVIALTFVLASCNDGDHAMLQQEKILRLERQVDSLTAELAARQPAANPWFEKKYGYGIWAKDVTDPEMFIDSSLRAKPELIPLNAVLGGKMTFKNILVLGSEWVIADYEDGHVSGQSIFSYKMDDNGDLEFRPLLVSEK